MHEHSMLDPPDELGLESVNGGATRLPWFKMGENAETLKSKAR